MRLGQHFLKNEKYISAIIKSLDINKRDIVIEVGAGHGELTKQLAVYPIKIIAVEKDQELARKLRFNIQQYQPHIQAELEIICGDILKELPKLSNSLSNRKYKLIGNIPYYLSGYLLRTISALKHKPSLIILTVQKEVAERIAAQPPKMNLLSAAIRHWANPKILFTIAPAAFYPPPKVSSAVVSLKPILKKRSSNDVLYYQFIRTLFKQPRKTILNNLSSIKDKQFVQGLLVSLGVNPKARPQELSVETIEKLFALLQ